MNEIILIPYNLILTLNSNFVTKQMDDKIHCFIDHPTSQVLQKVYMDENDKLQTNQIGPEEKEIFRKRRIESARRHIEYFLNSTTKEDYLDLEDSDYLQKKLDNIVEAFQTAYKLGIWEACIFLMTDNRAYGDFQYNEMKPSKFYLLLLNSGAWDRAIDFLKIAVESAIKLDRKEIAAKFHFQIADIYYKQGQYNLASEHTDKSRKILMKKRIVPGIIATLMMHSDIDWEQGFYDHAYKYLEMAKELATNMEEAEMLEAVNIKIEEYNRLMVDDFSFEEGVSHFEKLLSKAESVKDWEKIADSLYNLGVLYLGNEDFLNAENYLERANKICYQMVYPLAADIHLEFGKLHLYRNNLDLSYGNLLTCISFYEKLGNKRGHAEALSWMSRLYSGSEDYLMAESFATQSLEIYKEIGHFPGVAWTNVLIARAWCGMDGFDIAIECFNVAMELYERLEETEAISGLQLELGEAYINLKQFTEAEEIVQKAYVNFSNLGDKRSIIRALNLLRFLAYEKNDYMKAKTFVLEQLEIEKALNDINSIAITSSRLGFIYSRLGDKEQSKSSFIESVQAFESSEVKDNTLESFSYCQLGIIYFEEGDYSKASEYLNKTIHITNEADTADILAQALYYQGEIFRKQNKKELALEYLKRGLRIAQKENLPIAKRLQTSLNEMESSSD